MYFIVKDQIKSTLFLLIRFDDYINEPGKRGGFTPINPLVIYDSQGRNAKEMEDFYGIGLLHRYIVEDEREVIKKFFSGRLSD